MIRKMADNSSPTMTIEQTDNSFVIKLISMVSKKEVKFTIGEEFEETQQDGSIFKVSVILKAWQTPENVIILFWLI